MKQHITPEQLNELSKEGKKKLRTWWKPQVGDVYLSEDNTIEVIFCCEDEIEEEVLPLLSIGQMIEYLDDSLTNDFVIDFVGLQLRYKNFWYPFKENLRDALWEATKEKLEQ